VIKDKYLPYVSVTTWLRSTTFQPSTASQTWKNLLKFVHLLTNWLSWSLGSGHHVQLGRDRILGMGNSSFLSQNLLSILKQKNITLLYQARGPTRPDSFSSQWIESDDLGITEEVAEEWDLFRRALMGSGVYLQDRADELMWTGGDKSGLLFVKNAYNALMTTLWMQPIGGWRLKFWKWDLPLKIKLFIWLAVENKILSWDNLQLKGWEGPSSCHLCKKESETINHLMIHCIFTKKVWARICTGLKFKKEWEGNTITDCYKRWLEEKTVPTTLPALICWNIWLERNKVIFEQGSPSSIMWSQSLLEH
jgi:hypothetical protein